jgi:hypothetical protein
VEVLCGGDDALGHVFEEVVEDCVSWKQIEHSSGSVCSGVVQVAFRNSSDCLGRDCKGIGGERKQKSVNEQANGMWGGWKRSERGAGTVAGLERRA